MPRTGTSLSDEERAAFGAWLTAAINEHRIVDGKPASFSSVAKKLGGPKELATTTRVNQYARGAIIPTQRVAYELARATGTSWVEAFARAGHFGEFLRVIELAGTLPGFSAEVHDEAARADVRDEAVRLALRIFPRRDADRRTLGDRFASEPLLAALEGPAADEKFVLGLGLPKTEPLRSAALALSNTKLKRQLRRAIAAECVNAWADDIAPAIARGMRNEIQYLQGAWASEVFRHTYLEGSK